MTVDDSCVLCRYGKESLNHLFFQCSFSSVVWNEVWGKIPTSGVPSILEDAVVWFNGNVKGKSLKCLIMRSIIAADRCCSCLCDLEGKEP